MRYNNWLKSKIEYYEIDELANVSFDNLDVTDLLAIAASLVEVLEDKLYDSTKRLELLENFARENKDEFDSFLRYGEPF